MIELVDNLTAQELRVLQEFRRIGKKEMTLAEITAIKHPAGGGETPALSLLERGYLTSSETRQQFTLTPKAEELLALDPKPGDENLGTGSNIGEESHETHPQAPAAH